MQEFFEKLLNNLVIYAFFPSILFSTALLLLFKSSLSPVLLNDITTIYQELGFFVIGISFTLSLFLFYLRDFILEVYRGYNAPDFLSHIEIKREEKATEAIIRLVEKYNLLLSPNAIEKDINEIEEENISRLKDELYTHVTEYQQNFPSAGKIYCTRFGNILSAAETRVANRYGLDPVTIWPHLLQLIPAGHMQKIEDSLNQISLLINSSLLSFVFSIFCLIATIKTYLEADFWQSSYIVAGTLSFLVAYLFYLLSLPVAKKSGEFYCGAFHLFRFEIFRQLCIDLPKRLSDEADIWHNLSYLFAVGDYFGKIELKYNHTKKQAK